MYTCSVLVSVRQCSSAEISQIDVCFSKNLREAPTLKEYSLVFRHDPYGGGGWQKVERKPAQAPVNLGLPAPRHNPAEDIQPCPSSLRLLLCTGMRLFEES